MAASAPATPCSPDRAGSIATTAIVIASPSATRPPANRTLPDISGLHLDEDAYPQHAQHERHRADAQQDQPDVRGVEGSHVTPVAGQLPATDQYRQGAQNRSEEHTSELQSPCNLVCRLLLEK